MILPGRVALARKVLTNLRSTAHQTQPCGIDLTLKRVLQWSSSGTIDFDNTLRQTAKTVEIPFEPRSTAGSGSTTGVPHEYVPLSRGSYLIEFNEVVDMPLDLMGQILVRSSLFRSGVLLSAGVMDSGYKGAIGGLLQVVNPYGVDLVRDAKLAQMVFHQMTEPADAYNGTYQGRTTL